MAATVVRNGPFVQLTAIDADWIWTTTFPNHPQGIKVDWIAFKPGATALDKCSIKQDSATGSEIFLSIPAVSLSYGQIVYYSGALLRPYIDFSDCTFTTGHEVVIKLMTNSGC